MEEKSDRKGQQSLQKGGLMKAVQCSLIVAISKIKIVGDRYPVPQTK